MTFRHPLYFPRWHTHISCSCCCCRKIICIRCGSTTKPPFVQCVCVCVCNVTKLETNQTRDFTIVKRDIHIATRQRTSIGVASHGRSPLITVRASSRRHRCFWRSVHLAIDWQSCPSMPASESGCLSQRGAHGFELGGHVERASLRFAPPICGRIASEHRASIKPDIRSGSNPPSCHPPSPNDPPALLTTVKYPSWLPCQPIRDLLYVCDGVLSIIPL